MKSLLMQKSALFDANFLAFFLMALAGCTSGTKPPEQNPSLAANRTLCFSGIPTETKWNTFPMDYNAMESVMHGASSKAEAIRIWKGLPVPDETKETFVGYCGSYSYCTPLNFVDEKGSTVTGSAMVMAYGIMTGITPKSIPLFSGMRVYYWEFGDNSRTHDEQANREVFSDEHHYIFCLNKKFPSRAAAETLYQIPTLAPHLSGIIEIQPTFIAEKANPVLDVTPETLMEYTTYRGNAPEFQFVAQESNFAWSFDGRSGTVRQSSNPAAELVYALRTMQWKPLPSNNGIEANPSPIDTIIRLRSSNGTQELKLKYHKGLWYFRSAENILWGAPFPQLLHKVQRDCRNTIEKAEPK